METSLFTRLLTLGVHDGQPLYLRKKIKLTNTLALILMAGVGIPFTIISYFFFPVTTHLTVISVLIALGCMFLNAVDCHYGSRLLLSVTPAVTVVMYHAYIARADEMPVTGSAMLALGFMLIPFIIFDLREKGYLFASIVLVLLVMASYEYLNQWIEVDLDSGPFRSGYIAQLTYLIAIATVIGSVLVLLFENRRAEATTEQLLQEADESAQAVRASEQELKDNLAKLQQAQEEEKLRQWTSDGLTQATRLLREYEDMKTLCDQFIAFTVRYLRANQGGVFIVNEQDGEKVIELSGCYAYDRKKYLQKQIAPGEGLLGQTYLERDYTHLTEIPDDYLSITSGLGNANPTTLLIMPMLVNGQVEGLIELASFHPFADHEITFVQNLGEVVASAIRNSKTQEVTQQLLKSSQLQAADLRDQEKMMRQSMEELQATQEELHRKEQSYLARIEQLEQQATAK